MKLDFSGFKVRDLIRTTTFRLAMAQAAVFIVFAFALLSTVYLTTAGQLTRDAELSADEEFEGLRQLYAEGGLSRLNEAVIQRLGAASGAIYVLADANGAVISGHFDALPATPESDSERIVFQFERREGDGSITRRNARGRIGRLLNGPVLLVARDMGDAAAVVNRVTSAVWTGAALGLALSLLAGVIASRQAARRAEALSRTARDVMAGDLARRAPTWGAGDEFDSLASDINAMLARIERLVQASRTAGDSIAHDLRTPLTRMRQRMEEALARAPNAERDREALRKALEESDHLLTAFNAILRLARVQSAAGWTFKAVDLSGTLTDLAEFYEPAAEEAGVRFKAAIPQGLIVTGDGTLLAQALSNLIENALKYTPAGGLVEVAARRLASGEIEAAVRDSGPGVAPEDRERVTERFVRLEAARTTAGAGLGLSLVSAVAELHKGAFTLSDGVGGPHGPGLTAALRLPAAVA